MSPYTMDHKYGRCTRQQKRLGGSNVVTGVAVLLGFKARTSKRPNRERLGRRSLRRLLVRALNPDNTASYAGFKYSSSLGVFNKTIIPLTFVRYEIAIAKPARSTSLAIYHLLSNARSLNNC